MRFLGPVWLACLGLACAAELSMIERFVTAPQPHEPMVSPDRQHVLQVVDHWHVDAEDNIRSVYVLPLKDRKSITPIEVLSCPSKQATEVIWFDSDHIAYLNDSTLFSLPFDGSGSKPLPELVFEFPKGVEPTSLLRRGKVILFSGRVWADGDFMTVPEQDKAYDERGNSGMVFDELFVRHGESWRHPGKVWTVGEARLGDKTILNILNDTDLTDPMDPIDIAASKDILAMVIKPPHLNAAMHTRKDVYIVYKEHPSPKLITPYQHGEIAKLTFSPNGQRVAWTEIAVDGEESGRKVVMVHDLDKAGPGKIEAWTPHWDLSPSKISWSLDSESLYLLAADTGRTTPFHLQYPTHTPVALQSEGSTAHISQISDDSLLLSKSSLNDPSELWLLDMDDSIEALRFPQQITDWSTLTFTPVIRGVEVEEYWTKGVDGLDVMSWIITPPGFRHGDSAKWPMLFFVHGGPELANSDEWGGAWWNQALFAAEGYVVVLPNPTGSMGFGQEFVERVYGHWGDRTLKDLVAVHHGVLQDYPQIDVERTAMLGWSFGGYMANWIQGHNDQFGFKAIVCHDGIFDTSNMQYTTEELWFSIRDFGGYPSSEASVAEKWNPKNFVSEFQTPQLVVHGGQDFRLIEGEGIAMFTALQMRGVPSRFIYFPDEPHPVVKPGNQVKWYEEVFKWLEEWLGASNRHIASNRLVIQ